MTDASPRSFMMCEIIHRRARARVTQSAAVVASLLQGASLLFSLIHGRSEQRGDSLGALCRGRRTQKHVNGLKSGLDVTLSMKDTCKEPREGAALSIFPFLRSV